MVFQANKPPIKWNDLRIGMLRLCMDEIMDNKVRGNMAEVGVYKGDFAKYLNYYLPDRKLYLFDTFAGFDTLDNNENDKKLENNSDFSDASVEEVLKKMIKPEQCIVKKGYFPGTADGLEDEFCFVSLDADLYQPILAGLEYFYPRLQPGGYIFVHDYGTYAWNGVKKAVRKFCLERHVSYTPILDKGGSVIITK